MEINMSLVNEQDLFMKYVAMLIQYAQGQGFQVTGGELFRTPEQQKIYLDTGKSQTSNSNHLKRLAIDLNFFKDGKLTYDLAVLEPIGNYWESLSNKHKWGGHYKTFKDTPHFERIV